MGHFAFILEEILTCHIYISLGILKLKPDNMTMIIIWIVVWYLCANIQFSEKEM